MDGGELSTSLIKDHDYRNYNNKQQVKNQQQLIIILRI